MGDTKKHGSWSWFQMEELGDEPVYCEAPHGPDDVIYSGSEDEYYESATTRRLRYEAQALRYLAGSQPVLISASLRGPFTKESGWTNPWQSKRAKTLKAKATPPKSTKRREVVIPGTASHILEVDDADTEEEADQFAELEDLRIGPRTTNHERSSTQATSLYPLPSPGSTHAPSVISNPYMDSSAFNRVQKWRDDVKTTVATKEQFWAPNAANERPGTKKRASDSEWLRKEGSKRAKLDIGDSSMVDSPIDTILGKRTVRPSISAKTTAGSSTNEEQSVERRQLRSKPQREQGSFNERTTRKISDMSHKERFVSQAASPSDIPVSDASVDASQSPSTESKEYESMALSVGPPQESFNKASRSRFPLPGNSESAVNVAQDENPSQVSGDDLQDLHQAMWRKWSKQTSDSVQQEPLPSRIPQDSEEGGNDENINTKDEARPSCMNSNVDDHTELETQHDRSFLYRARVKKEAPVSPALVPSASLRRVGSVSSFSEFSSLSSIPDEFDQSDQQSHTSHDQEGHHHLQATGDGVDVPSAELRTADSISTFSGFSTLTSISSEDQQNFPSHIDSGLDPAEVTGEDDELEPDTPEDENTNIEIEGLEALQTHRRSPMQRSTPSDTSDSSLTSIEYQSDFEQFAHTQNNPKPSVKDCQVKQSLVDRHNDTPAGSMPQAEIVVSDDANDRDETDLSKTRKDESKLTERNETPLALKEQHDFRPQSPWTKQSQEAAYLPPSAGLATKSIAHGRVGVAEGISDHGYDKLSENETAGLGPTVATLSSSHNSDASRRSSALPGPSQIEHISTQTSSFLGLDVIASQALSAVRSLMPWSDHGPELPAPPSQSGAPTSPPDRQLLSESFDRSDPWEVMEAVPAQTTSTAIRPTTPDKEKSPSINIESSIKPFSNFLTPSPEKQWKPKRVSLASGGRLPSTQILVDATTSNPWDKSSAKSNRRVSFAPLPGENNELDHDANKENEDEAAELPTHSVTPSHRKGSARARAASPPLPAHSDDLQDHDHRFAAHFQAMAKKNRLPRLGQRLLPSASQQVLGSPRVEAMAEAFIEAEQIQPDSVDSESASPGLKDQVPDVAQHNDESMDEVSAVIDNLGDFLNAFDVDAELAEARPAAGASQMTGLEVNVWST